MAPVLISSRNSAEMIEAALVVRAVAGDRTAMGEIARRVYPRVVAFCRSRVFQLADAEELAQETLLRAMTSLAALQNQQQFGSWLRSIASNVCHTWHRDRRVTQALASEPAASSGSGPDNDIADADERDLLLERIRELPTDLQEVVYLFYYEEMTYDEMSRWLDVARATVNERLGKAREQLRIRLGASRSPSA